jgi:hypothetical protein
MKNEQIQKLIRSIKIVDSNNNSIASLTLEQRQTVGLEILAETEKEINKISSIVEDVIDERITLSLSGKSTKKRSKNKEEIDIL